MTGINGFKHEWKCVLYCVDNSEGSLGFDTHKVTLKSMLSINVNVFSSIDPLYTHIILNLFSLQARIKKIMQTDEEIGKVAAAVPVIICILPDKHLHCESPTVSVICMCFECTE